MIMQHAWGLTAIARTDKGVRGRYYSLFTLGMLVVFECTTVLQRIRSMRELRTLQTPKQALMVHRSGKWAKVPGDALVPGDVISISRPTGTALRTCRLLYRACGTLILRCLHGTCIDNL